MWLQILQSCKHERDAFVAGELRCVSGATADVLIAMGWARQATDPQAVTLQIHPGTLGVADTLKGT